MSYLQVVTILSIIKDRLTIKNGTHHDHRRGCFIAGDLELDGTPILSYTQHGDGSEPDIDFVSGGRKRCEEFLNAINFNDAMIADNWLDAGEVAPLDYQISTAFDCLYFDTIQ